MDLAASAPAAARKLVHVEKPRSLQRLGLFFAGRYVRLYSIVVLAVAGLLVVVVVRARVFNPDRKDTHWANDRTGCMLLAPVGCPFGVLTSSRKAIALTPTPTRPLGA